MEESKLRWGFNCESTHGDSWSLGLGLSNGYGEHYIYINLIFLYITFGKQYLKVRKSK